MKKCPKCKAEIQENARFCLYCMTSFEEKEIIKSKKETKKQWICILAVVILVASVVFGIFISIDNDNLLEVSGNKYSDLQTSYKNDAVTSNCNNSDISNQQPQNREPENIEESVFANENDNTQILSKNENSTNFDSTSATETTVTNTKNTVSTIVNVNNTISNNTIPKNNKENDNNSNTKVTDATTLPSTPPISYYYRDAKYGDDFSVSADLENCVVITGVKTVSYNGEYSIPEMINGKKVIAIMGLAFCEDNINKTVKKVIVPSTVKTIWNNAFANCYNLTDIYFCGNAIYTEAYAFPESSKRNGTLTIHCSTNCNDRNFRYYKNSASNYDAEYAEWNG